MDNKKLINYLNSRFELFKIAYNQKCYKVALETVYEVRGISYMLWSLGIISEEELDNNYSKWYWEKRNELTKHIQITAKKE